MATSWLSIPEGSDFTLKNLPYGAFTVEGSNELGIAIGDEILRLTVFAQSEFVPKGLRHAREALQSSTLNDFMALGKATHLELRNWIQSELVDSNSALRHASFWVKQSKVEMKMPVAVGDYTDFYSSRDHATNVGKMFRDPENALLPNWLHIPVGYHGRSSSIVVSGTPLHRPKGQILPKGETVPVYAPCRLLDFELEMAFVIGKESNLGSPITTGEASEYIFGVVLFNDWSARDIQKWEYVPLGPFLGKNWGSSISPWIVPMEALEPYGVSGPVQEPAVLPYLVQEHSAHYDISLEVHLQAPDQSRTKIVDSNFKHMYWSMHQQLAHHTVNGCNVRVGDMMASGTISGPEIGSFGSMLELSWAGSRTINLVNGETRKFVNDGDTIIMKGSAGQGADRVGFGEVRTSILPAHE